MVGQLRSQPQLANDENKKRTRKNTGRTEKDFSATLLFIALDDRDMGIMELVEVQLSPLS